MRTEFDTWSRDQIETGYRTARRNGGEYWEGATLAYEAVLKVRFGPDAVTRAKLGVNFTDHRLLFDVKKLILAGDTECAIGILDDIITRKVRA
jgi:hypothetical protein